MRQKLLIVDDEKGIVDMMADYFAAQYDVLTAYSGREALQKVTACPDLILLDINMPDMNGLAVCQEIREYVACPILFLTARVESADKISGFRAGADDYIVKPFDLDELAARVEAHLRREQRRQGSATVRFFLKRNLILWNFCQSMPGRCLTGSGFTRRYGDMTGRETATRSWNIFARSGQSLLPIRAMVISIQSGGVVTDGMVEKHGASALLFSVVSALSGGGAAVDLWSLWHLRKACGTISRIWHCDRS